MYAIRSYYERIVLHNQGDDANAIRAMQHFMSQGAWLDSPILKRHWQEVEQEIGSEDGVLIADGSGIRITSYNVCYTKLLRSLLGEAEKSNSPNPLTLQLTQLYKGVT